MRSLFLPLRRANQQIEAATALLLLRSTSEQVNFALNGIREVIMAVVGEHVPVNLEISYLFLCCLRIVYWRIRGAEEAQPTVVRTIRG